MTNVRTNPGQARLLAPGRHRRQDYEASSSASFANASEQSRAEKPNSVGDRVAMRASGKIELSCPFLHNFAHLDHHPQPGFALRRSRRHTYIRGWTIRDDDPDWTSMMIICLSCRLFGPQTARSWFEMHFASEPREAICKMPHKPPRCADAASQPDSAMPNHDSLVFSGSHFITARV